MRLIDADALLNDPANISSNEFGDDVVYVEDINKAPTVERPHGEWIPCSERLPEEHSIYLTTIKKANGITFTAHSYFFTKEVGWSDAGVIAWMPLPEPYEKEGEAE